MATRYNYTGNIVTQGLVLNLDAAKTDSYPGTGTTWRDLSGFNNNGTLTNGPTFSGLGKQASIVFDGVNDFVNCGPSFTSLDLINKSFSAWIFKTSASQKGIIDKDFDSGGPNYGGWGFWIQPNNKLWWWNQGGQDITDDGPNTITLNSWNHVAVTYNSVAKNATFYINGTLNSSITNANVVEKPSGNASLVIGAIRNNLGGFSFNGRISNVLAYNRLLTASEVQQNFQALRGRYGV
jgi:hypothetical protein